MCKMYIIPWLLNIGADNKRSGELIICMCVYIYIHIHIYIYACKAKKHTYVTRL